MYPVAVAVILLIVSGCIGLPLYDTMGGSPWAWCSAALIWLGVLCEYAVDCG